MFPLDWAAATFHLHTNNTRYCSNADDLCRHCQQTLSIGEHGQAAQAGTQTSGQAEQQKTTSTSNHSAALKTGNQWGRKTYFLLFHRVVFLLDLLNSISVKPADEEKTDQSAALRLDDRLTCVQLTFLGCFLPADFT